MPEPEKSPVPVLRLAILSAFLVVQMGAFYGAAHYETPPVIAALAQFPTQVADWRTIRDIPMEKGVQEVLRADDTLSRVYADTASGESASLFIAFFRTQRTGQAPQSPKTACPARDSNRPTLVLWTSLFPAMATSRSAATWFPAAKNTAWSFTGTRATAAP